MQRLYLHDPLPVETLRQVKAWQARINVHSFGSDSVWTVVDGALLGTEGAEHLQSAYGAAMRAFDDTPLAAYEEFGLLLWPWDALDARDGLELLRTTMADRPGVSFVRVGPGRSGALGHVLAWLAGATTADGMPLYLRVGDTRVLSSLLQHIQPAQKAQLQTAIREWIWPDRSGRAQSMVIETDAPSAEIASPFVMDDAQYGAMLEDAAADILHAALRPIESAWHDQRTGAQLHTWVQRVLHRCSALGITRQQDQLAFASLALRVSGNFEAAPELGETWFRVRSMGASLPDEVERWTPREWSAMERFWQAT